MKPKLDEIDWQILQHLRANARKTFVDIGKTLTISDATVYNRVKRLVRLGVIRRFTIEVDEAAAGHRTRGFILVNVEPGSVTEASKQICGIKGVSEVYEVHGSEDFIVMVEADNLRKLRPVILRLRKVPGVINTEFTPIFKTWKD